MQRIFVEEGVGHDLGRYSHILRTFKWGAQVKIFDVGCDEFGIV